MSKKKSRFFMGHQSQFSLFAFAFVLFLLLLLFFSFALKQPYWLNNNHIQRGVNMASRERMESDTTEIEELEEISIGLKELQDQSKELYEWFYCLSFILFIIAFLLLLLLILLVFDFFVCAMPCKLKCIRTSLTISCYHS